MVLYRTIGFSSLCDTYKGLTGEFNMGYISLVEGPLNLTLAPGDPLPPSTCSVSIFGSPGQGVGVHIASLQLATPLASGRCTSWLQIESEYERSQASFVRVKSSTQRICGTIEQRRIFVDSEPWKPEHQFFNETNSHQVTVKFTPGQFQRSLLAFSLIITPLTLSCAATTSNSFDGDLFHCGDKKDAGSYCIDSGLVCDGRVNCLLPGQQARDESNVFCQKLGGRKADPVKIGREYTAFRPEQILCEDIIIQNFGGRAIFTAYTDITLIEEKTRYSVLNIENGSTSLKLVSHTESTND